MDSDSLRLTPAEFDSSKRGWRILAARGHDLAAAKLILRYINERKDAIQAGGSPSLATFYFHAGQEYACAGREHYSAAIVQMRKAHKADSSWNAYVNATIGFLTEDEQALASGIRELGATSPELTQILKKLEAGLPKSKQYREVYDS